MTAPTPPKRGRFPEDIAVALDQYKPQYPGPGQLWLNEDRAPVIHYGSETAMRQGLAKLAYAYGWSVTEEVVIPGWGRIDLALAEPGEFRAILIELKQRLDKPADIRRAFQQADGYGRWWVGNRDEPAQVILSAGAAKTELIQPVAAAYPEVRFQTLGQVMAGLLTWGRPGSRLFAASHREQELTELLAVHRYVNDELLELVDRP
jgi:hypothetical protein